MKRYMLDTNMVSYFIKAHPQVVAQVVGTPMSELCISAITEAELLFGLAKLPQAKRLHDAVREFLLRVDSLPWDSSITQKYATVRAEMKKQGKTLAPLDLLIAAHALSVGSTLVTNDQAFAQVPNLQLEDWTSTH
jgi:tRNA(fMet)-specific endonuclease VapC